MAGSDRASRRRVGARCGAGVVIPAHPLALTAARRLDERRQRALTRYYVDAGAGGIAVGVHTTQFAIRDPSTAAAPRARAGGRDGPRATRRRARAVVLVAGVCRADRAGRRRGGARRATSATTLVPARPRRAARRGRGRRCSRHCRAVAEVLPVFGFYLQPAVGGRVLRLRNSGGRSPRSSTSWAIKIAPFNRYQTLDVVRAVAEAGPRRHRALHGQRRPHRARPRDALPHRRSRGARSSGESSAGCWATGRSGRSRRCACSASAAPLATRRRGRLATLLRGATRSPTRTRRSSTRRTASPAASPACTRCCGGRGCWRAPGASTRTKTCRPARPRRSTGCTRAYPHLNDDEFVTEHLDDWLR